MRRVLELRQGGAQAAVKKIDALLAHAGDDDRIRGAFRYHGAATGRAGLVKGISRRISNVLLSRRKSSTPPSLRLRPATTSICVRGTSGR